MNGAVQVIPKPTLGQVLGFRGLGVKVRGGFRVYGPTWSQQAVQCASGLQVYAPEELKRKIIKARLFARA